MKFGPVEGTEEEVNNLFQNNGLNLSEYIVKPDVPLKKIWLILPSTVLVACFSVLTLSDSLSNSVKMFVFLLGFSASVWAAVSVNIRFKSAWGSGALMLGGVLIMLVALGVISPVELLEYYRSSQENA
jgi:hypothetical protein